jgi:YfiH family protein
MPPLLRSSLLPVPHGFSTREGGVSEGPFATLNLAANVGDQGVHVSENLHRLAGWLEVRPDDIATASQVHGRNVVQVAPPRAESLGDADALWTESPGFAVGVRTADCVPVLFVDAEAHRVAAVHSGWKGTQLEVVGALVDAWRARGARPERLLAAIGPSIRLCCYEVSEDLARTFAVQFGAEVTARDNGPPHLDLVRALTTTLVRRGLNPAHIDVLPHCTACAGNDFYSHRRDRGRTGRHLNLVACRF